MNSTMFYWVITLIILIILSMLTDISTACLTTAIIITLKHITQNPTNDIASTQENVMTEVVEKPEEKTKSVGEKKEPEGYLYDNKKTLDSVLDESVGTADDRIFETSIIAGYKDKKAKEIRSHWNNNNWKRYYDYELGIHETENREWWTDNDYELAKKHIVI